MSDRTSTDRSEHFSNLRRLYERRGDSAQITREDGGVRFLKVRSLAKDHLVELCEEQGIETNGREIWELRKSLFLSEISEERINSYIREKYELQRQQERQEEEVIKQELQRLQTYQSSVWLGNVDSMLQRTVRRVKNLSELEEQIQQRLLPMVSNYVKWSWYNQWTERIIGNIFTDHEEVIPTLRRVKAVDFFIREVPFDLKLTFLPKGFIEYVEGEHGSIDVTEAINFALNNPQRLAKWLYENQGPVRFDNSNRMFLVLINVENLDESWRLKSAFDLVEMRISEFLESREEFYQVNYYYDKSDIYRGNYVATCFVLFVLSESS